MDCGKTKYRRKQYIELIVETIANIPETCIKVDVLTAIDILKEFKVLTSEKCQTLTRLCSNFTLNKERLKVFSCNIYKSGSLEFLFQILDLIGLGYIANDISTPTSICRQVHRVELPLSKDLQLFYYRLKQNIDWKTFFDTAEILKQKYNTFIGSFKDFKEDDDKLKAAGRLAVVAWLRIQHCKRDTTLIRDVLNGMIENWPKGIDDTLGRIFYHSKMAIAAVIDGDVTSAEDHSRIAKHLSASFHDPLTKALICHDSRYTNQRIFEHQGSETHRKAVLDEAITGLCFLESDSNGCEEFYRQMKRMFLLYIAQYRLNIHNDMNCRDSDHLSADAVKNASNALECFKRTREDNELIDPRRRMIYYVCKARVQESNDQFSQAAKSLSKATELAGEGAHYMNEAINIRDFTNRLLTRN